MKRLYTIKTHSPYVTGILRHELRLTFRERLTILFHGGIALTLVNDKRWPDYTQKQLEMMK